MDSLSIELLYAISELLPRHALAQLCRVNRRCCADLQPLLFRLHGHQDDWRGPSAVFWAVDTADSSDGASQTLALAVLAKVEAFCRLEPGDLDRSFRRQGCNDAVWAIHRARRGSLLDGDCSKDWPSRLGMHASFNPLHLAAHKGLDSIVAWLLAHGANVNALIEATTHNAVIPAVVANHTSTVLLLLAHGADQAVDMKYDGFSFDSVGRTAASGWYKPAVTSLAAALGYDTMAEKLMDSGFVSAANPSEMLYIYAQHGHSRGTFVASLVRRGAEASLRMLQHLVTKAGPYWSKFPLTLLEAVPVDGPFPTQPGISSFPQKTVLDITRTFQRDNYFSDFHDNHYDRTYYDSDVENAQRALRGLLMFRGVDIDACGRSLWRQSSYQAFDYALVKFLLPPFLEAGMDLQCRKKEELQEGTYRDVSRKTDPDDLLAAASCYDSAQCAKGIVKQLDVVVLLVKHGAPITAATLEHALRDHPVGPSAYTTVGRSGWAVQVCNAIMGHCHSVPEEEQREDMRNFVALYKEKTSRVSFVNVDK